MVTIELKHRNIFSFFFFFFFSVLLFYFYSIFYIFHQKQQKKQKELPMMPKIIRLSSITIMTKFETMLFLFCFISLFSFFLCSFSVLHFLYFSIQFSLDYHSFLSMLDHNNFENIRPAIQGTKKRGCVYAWLLSNWQNVGSYVTVEQVCACIFVQRTNAKSRSFNERMHLIKCTVAIADTQNVFVIFTNENSRLFKERNLLKINEWFVSKTSALFRSRKQSSWN